MRILTNLMIIFATYCEVYSLDNGVARTPPMGWLDWERFECNMDCKTDPDNCISEQLFMKMADIMASEGYRDVGYEYVAIDDCWLANERDSEGKLQPDPERFPHGMKYLADYIHSKGLKLGLYEDIGTKTCAGFPGSEGHFELDAQTFADWGIDMIKFDGCNSDIPKYATGFPEFRDALNKTGRHIVYSCEWPMYAKAKGLKANFKFYQKVAATCNVFRQLTDIYDSWDSVIGQINYFGDDPGNFSGVANPGAWNDPDQVVIGNYGLSVDQQRVQMAMFSMLAAPLLMSNDLRSMPPESKAILLNRGIIAINQDPLGVQATRIIQMNNGLSVWRKPILPSGSVALAFMYVREIGGPLKVVFNLTQLNLTNPSGYNISEVFEGTNLGVYKVPQNFTCYVNPTGVYVIKATPIATNSRILHSVKHTVQDKYSGQVPEVIDDDVTFLKWVSRDFPFYSKGKKNWSRMWRLHKRWYLKARFSRNLR